MIAVGNQNGSRFGSRMMYLLWNIIEHLHLYLLVKVASVPLSLCGVVFDHFPHHLQLSHVGRESVAGRRPFRAALLLACGSALCFLAWRRSKTVGTGHDIWNFRNYFSLEVWNFSDLLMFSSYCIKFCTFCELFSRAQGAERSPVPRSKAGVACSDPKSQVVSTTSRVAKNVDSAGGHWATWSCGAGADCTGWLVWRLGICLMFAWMDENHEVVASWSWHLRLKNVKMIQRAFRMNSWCRQRHCKRSSNCWCPLAGEAANAQAAAVTPGQTLAGPSAGGPADRGYTFQSPWVVFSFTLLRGWSRLM